MKARLLYWSPLGLTVLICATLMTIWAFAVPIYEAPDEPLHWANAQYIHDHLALPPYDGTYEEGNQAPLYYMLIAPFASSPLSPQILISPGKAGIELSCPPRFFVDCPGDSHRYLALRRGRLASIAIGLIGIVFTGLGALELSGSIWTACVAAGLIGLLPQFDFRSASVNNDVAAAAFSAMGLYFAARMVMRPYSRKIGILAGIGVGFAVLSKINAGVMLPFFVVAILLTAGEMKARIRRLWLLGVPLLLMLPWMIHNKIVLGDLLGLSAMPGVVPMFIERKTLADPYFVTTLPTLGWASLIGYFGWMNIPSPGIVYDSYRLIIALGLIGLLVWLATHAERWRFILLVATIPVMSVCLFIYFNLMLSQPQGRLLFPMLSAAAILLALGLSCIEWSGKYVAALVILVCGSLNAFTIRKVIIPSYWAPVERRVLTDVVIPDTLLKGGPLGPITAGSRFTQSFIAKHNELAGADIEVGAFSKKRTRGTLELGLALTEGGVPVVRRQIDASTIPDCCIYVHLDFAPMHDSAGKKYFISLVPSDMADADAITVFVSVGDVYADGEDYLNGKPLGSDTAIRTFYSPTVFCGRCLDSQ